MTERVTVIIVNWNTRDLLEQCLRSVYQTGQNLLAQVIVVDNDSTDDSMVMVRTQFPQVRLLQNDRNVGFARANNQAAAASQGQYLLLLNSDALLQPGALHALVTLAETQPQAGIVGAQLLNVDGTFQASYSPFPGLKQEFLILSGLGRLLRGRHYPSRGPEQERGPQQVDYVEGACMLVRREAYQAVGGLDEGYFMYAEDVDLCYAIHRRGWQVWYQPEARVVHLGGASSRNRRPQREGDLYRSRVRFFRKYYGRGAARCLGAMILGATFAKLALHRVFRLLSGGRFGRQVVPLGLLIALLKEA